MTFQAELELEIAKRDKAERGFFLFEQEVRQISEYGAITDRDQMLCKMMAFYVLANLGILKAKEVWGNE